MSEKYLIFGAGAIGSVIGGFMAKAGNKIVLFGRQHFMEDIRNNGLKISGIWGEHQIKNISCYWELKDLSNQSFDIIFLSVRTYDIDSALQQIRALVGENTLIVSLQNGLGNIEKIAGIIGAEKTIGGRVIFGAKIIEPAHVSVTVYAEEVMLGPIRMANEKYRIGNYKKMMLLADIMTKSGIPTKATMEIEKYLWAKVLYNSALNPISALLSASYGELAENPFAKQIMKKVIQEIFHVAKTKQIQLFWEKPEEYFDKFFNQEIPLTAAHRSSMLQAIESGRPVEIDALNGAIVELAKELKLDVPMNDLLTRLVKAKEYKIRQQER